MNHKPIFGVNRTYMFLVIMIAIPLAWGLSMADRYLGWGMDTLFLVPLLIIPIGWFIGRVKTTKNPNFFAETHMKIQAKMNGKPAPIEGNTISGDVCPVCQSKIVETVSGGSYDSGAHRDRLCHECGCFYRENYIPNGVVLFQTVDVDGAK